MYEFLHRPDFVAARKNRQYFFFTGVLRDTPGWDDVFRNLEASIETQSLIKIGPVFSLVLHEGERIRQAGDFLGEIRKLDPTLEGSAHVYIGLSRFSEGFGRHQDNSDVFFWQVIGSTRWKVFMPTGVKEHVLQVGDVIYVPRHTDHEVTSLSPRVGISFGLDYGKKPAKG